LRAHIAPAPGVVIPNHKLEFDQSNPTEPRHMFTRPDGAVFCTMPPGGV
jgi:hypothetical protein